MKAQTFASLVDQTNAVMRSVVSKTEERRKICNELGLPHVPVICEKYVLYGSIKHIREYACGEGMNKGGKERMDCS